LETFDKIFDKDSEENTLEKRHKRLILMSVFPFCALAVGGGIP
jgi:hypothetical protein